MSYESKSLQLDIVGSSTFGIDPKVLASRTFNMIISDDFLVDYCGYKNVLQIVTNSKGRGIFTSSRANSLIVCIGNVIYSISLSSTTLNNQKIYSFRPVGEINSFSGDVFFDENNVGQIGICDKSSIYVYNHITDDFDKAVLPDGFVPGYITYQNGRFIAPDSHSASWALSDVGNGLNWFWGASGEPVLGAIQTKANFARVTIRFPGRGNLLLVMGDTVTELWTDIGNPQFPYQRSASVNIDYGCLNPATVAASDQFIIWLGINEKSGPVIMYTSGSDISQISTDGINYKLAQLNNPSNSAGFFMKLNGHLIYQLTFYDPSDNYTLLYDFTTRKFFDATDENMNFHIARRVAFFEDDYYFVSFSDGNVYQISSDLYEYDYGDIKKDIPKVRVCSNIRMPDTARFIINEINLTVEQGNDTYNDFNDTSYFPRISLTVSKNGGISFSGSYSKKINHVGIRQNRIRWWNMGIANDFVPQFRFYGKGSFKITYGSINIYK